ncbi:MAG: hypothetical protein WC584_03255 [Candidatus Pacearchaeota archaeon]
MIKTYGILPIKEKNMGELALSIIRGKYDDGLHRITREILDSGARNYTFDVNGRAVNIHALPGSAYIKICGADEKEIEQTKKTIEKLLSKENPELKLESMG